MLTEKINSLLEQVEMLGCEGKVEEAQGVMKLCDQLKDDRETLRMGGDPSQVRLSFSFEYHGRSFVLFTNLSSPLGRLQQCRGKTDGSV